ncbi:hypothetical protein [Corynebacterium timonense]|uniref:SIS domain-containing protein n=1 Tax=Corynebacterium timonense TaxID=441500 RepID=A0A1H1RSF2_9CORY|nr:hypothetical protein [Corynebacterium timonense]SDS38630.1 hypothetical protein SAMN04488539_1574 [Corynebacterium timonense]
MDAMNENMDASMNDDGDYFAGAGGYDRETVRFFDVAHEGAQVRGVAQRARDLERLRGINPRSVVVVGTDQVSRAAAAAALQLRAPLPLPVVVTHVLPDYVGPLDVVVVVGECSEDARTGQDTRSLLTAARRGAETVLAGPARGPILDDAPDTALLVPALPTTASASPLRAMALVWAVLDALAQPAEITAEFLGALADEVDAEIEALSPQRDDTVNAARQLAMFADGARIVHTGAGCCGRAVAALAAQVWTAQGLVSGYTEEPLDNAPADDIFHDPLIDGPSALVPLRAIVWAAPDTALPASRAEYVEPTGLGEASSAARLVARAYAATAMDA